MEYHHIMDIDGIHDITNKTKHYEDIMVHVLHQNCNFGVMLPCSDSSKSGLQRSNKVLINQIITTYQSYKPEINRNQPRTG